MTAIGRQITLFLATAFASTACEKAGREPKVTKPSVNAAAHMARFDGIGPVRAGMRLTDAARALGDRVPAIPRKKEACNYVNFDRLPNVALMIIGDTIMRFDVDTLVKTVGGAQAGDAERAVIERYKGSARVSPHHYTGPEGHYITVDSPDDTLHRLIFETDGKKVTTYRFGRKEQVGWVEGCS